METGEIAYTGSIWKVASLKDGGWRVTVDLSTGDIPVLRPDDIVALALMKPESDKPAVF